MTLTKNGYRDTYLLECRFKENKWMMMKKIKAAIDNMITLLGACAITGHQAKTYRELLKIDIPALTLIILRLL